MPNNSPEQIRKKLYEEYEDSLFKLIMHDIAEKEGTLLLEEKEQLKNDPEYLPSNIAFQRFNKQLDAQLRKPNAHTRRQRILKSLNRVAVAMLIVIVISVTTVATAQAVRVRVLNFLMDIHPKYTSFELKDKDNSPDGRSSMIEWRKAYVPTYIPAGYKVSDISNGELFKKIQFKNQQGLFITYTELRLLHNSKNHVL